jgi:hypothetical protein
MLAVLAYVTAFCLYAVLRRCVLTRVVMFTEHKIFKIFLQIPPTDGSAIAFLSRLFTRDFKVTAKDQS